MKGLRRWIALGLVGAGGLWLALRSPAETAPVAVATEAAEAPGAPAPAPAATAKVGEEPAAQQPPVRRPKKVEDPNAPYALQETEEDLRERATEREELSRRFNKERADVTWTDEAGRRVAELLAKGNLPSSSLRAVDCRQTICRFVLASGSSRDREVRMLTQAARDLDEQTWLHPEKQEDDTWRMEVFFPRDGYWLSSGGDRMGETKPVVDAPDLERSSKGG